MHALAEEFAAGLAILILATVLAAIARWSHRAASKDQVTELAKQLSKLAEHSEARDDALAARASEISARVGKLDADLARHTGKAEGYENQLVSLGHRMDRLDQDVRALAQAALAQKS